MKAWKQNVTSHAVATMALGLALLAGGCASAPATGAAAPETVETVETVEAASFPTGQQLSDWNFAWNFVNSGFYDPGLKGVDWPRIRDNVAEKIESGMDWPAFHELLRTTMTVFGDDHTTYQPPLRTEAFDIGAGGSSFGGVGLIMAKGNGEYISVVIALPGGAAGEAGLAPHDRILKVDGGPALDERGEPAIARIRGPVGSTVRLLVASPACEREVALQRRQVFIANAMIQGNTLETGRTGGKRVGYILLANVQDGAALALRSEFIRLSADSPLDGLILDLRTNAGGLPNEAASVLGLFLTGVVGANRDREGRLEPFEATGDAVLNSRDIPLAVLVDERTISGGEIVAASLKTRARAVLVGERTAGGLGEGHYRDLSGGGTIMVTKRIFCLEDGTDPGWLNRGIEPDIAIPDSGWDDCFGGRDIAIDAAVKALGP